MSISSVPQRQRLDLLRDAAVLSSGTMVAMLALVLLSRRLAGQWQPLPSLMLLSAGLVLVIFAQLWRIGWQANGTPREPVWHQWLGRIGPSVILFCFAIAFSVPGTSILGLVLFWLLIVGTESYVVRQYATPRQRREVATPVPNEVALTLEDAIEDAEDESGELLPGDVWQQITRHSTESVETVTCLLRVPFAVGEQTHTVHVAFCPPLEGRLTSRCEHVDGAACEIKVSLVESFGARLEVKRRGPLALADEAVVLLEARGATESIARPTGRGEET